MMLLQQPTWTDGGAFPLDVYPFEGAMVRMTSNQTIATGSTGATLTFGAAEYDTSGFWSAGSPKRLTVQDDGYAMVFGAARWATVTSATARAVRPYLNGAVFQGAGGSSVSGPASGSGARQMFVSAMIPVSAGDYFEMHAAHGRGSNLSVDSNTSTFFGIYFVPDALVAMLKLTSDVSLTGGAVGYVDWDAVEFDNIGVWDAGEPSHLQIPGGFPHPIMLLGGAIFQILNTGVGISVDRGEPNSRAGMSLPEQMGSPNVVSSRLSCASAVQNPAYDTDSGAPGSGLGIDTAPNYYRAQYYTGSTQNLTAHQQTYLAICAMPGVRRTMIYHDADQSIPDSTHTEVEFSATRVLYDDAGCHNSANPNRLTVPSWYSSGYAMLVANQSWDDNTSWDRWMYFIKNGIGFEGNPAPLVRASNTDRTRMHLFTIVPVVAGDYFNIMAWQNSGSTRTIIRGNTTTFTMHLMPV